MPTRIYLFDQAGVFVGEDFAGAPPAPGEGEIFPWNSTRTAPPAFGEAQVPVWNGAAWSLVPDHRGTEYWLADGSRHRITEAGQEVPGNASLSPPDAPEPEAPKAYVKRGQLAVACSQPPFQIITEAEAEDWAVGTALPPSFRDAIGAADMTSAEKLAARIDARTVENIQIDHWMVKLAAETFGMSPAEKEALFDAAAEVG